MTVRNPIVLIPGGNPQFQELPAGDVLGGAAQGPVGITWQGTWSSGTSYAVDDAVEHDGYAYIAIQAGTNQTPAPAGTAYWDLLASKGDAATIAVGTVTTGAAGSSASVTNSGSSGAAVFDFTIPRGDTGAGGGLTKIARVVTSSSQATITFSSISGAYTNLRLVVSGRDTATGSGGVSVRIKFNSDATAANYEVTQQWDASNTATGVSQAASTTSGAIAGTIPGTTGNANAQGIIDMLIPNYSGTTFYKIFQSMSSYYRNANPGVIDIGFRASVWKSAAAITDIVLTAGGTAFVDGTTATLYGLD